MVLNGDGKVKTEIKLNGEVLKEVEKFKYLGSWITTNGGHMTDIKCRIAETKIAFADMKNILANLKMPFDLRYRILNCYVMPILLYGCENWILNQQQIKRLEATEMWFIRRMQKISWKEKKTNEQVLRETIGKRKLIQKIVQRQVSFFGHVMRKGQLENIITTAKINGNGREENHRSSIWIKLKNGPSKIPSRAWCRKCTNGLYWLPKSIDKARKKEKKKNPFQIIYNNQFIQDFVRKKLCCFFAIVDLSISLSASKTA